MASEVEICNLALTELGDFANKISALGEDGIEGETCEILYPQVRDAMIESHVWNFALGRSSLSKLSEGPPFEYANQFQLPGDILRAVAIWNTDEFWEIEGDMLLTDEGSINLKYIRKITDTGLFPALFTTALYLELAVRMHKTITGANPPAVLIRKAEKAFKEAKRRDGQEGTPTNLRISGISVFKDSRIHWKV